MELGNAFEWIDVAEFLVKAFLFGFGTNVFTELLKKLSRLIGPKLGWEGMYDDVTKLVSGLVAALIIFVPDANLLGVIDGIGLENLNPDMAKVFSAAISMSTANNIHKFRKGK